MKISSIVELVDIAPTLLEAAGLTMPTGMQGKSRTPVLTGQTTAHRESAYMEYYNAVSHYTPTPMATSVRTDKYKLAYYQTLSTGELYDMTKDPGRVEESLGNGWSQGHPGGDAAGAHGSHDSEHRSTGRAGLPRGLKQAQTNSSAR